MMPHKNKSVTKMVENDIVFSRITCVFGALKDCSPPNESPGRGPAARRKVFRTTGQSMISSWKLYYFVIHVSLFTCVLFFNQIWMKSDEYPQSHFSMFTLKLRMHNWSHTQNRLSDFSSKSNLCLRASNNPAFAYLKPFACFRAKTHTWIVFISMIAVCLSAGKSPNAIAIARKEMSPIWSRNLPTNLSPLTGSRRTDLTCISCLTGSFVMTWNTRV